MKWIDLILKKASPVAFYNVSSGFEASNLEMTKMICGVFDNVNPRTAPHSQLTSFVADRKGHDFRYAINCSKIKNELGWLPYNNFSHSIIKLIEKESCINA